MCKKFGILVAIVAALVIGLRWTGAGSYTRTAFQKLQAQVKGQVPLEFEIARLQNEIKQVMPNMKKNLVAVAQETVAVENLKKEINVTKDNLAKQEAALRTMTQDLKNNSAFITYNGKTYSAERIQQKLARDFASYQVAEKELAAREQLLEAKERTLDAAREQLAVMKSQKQKLDLQVAQLEAELKHLRLTQSQSEFHFDDSQLSRCKELLGELRTRLDVEKTTMELEGQFANDFIKVEEKP
ncbi:MAG: coiled-coil domain-containing protein, partial [Gemmataceae bacterium]